MDHSERDNNKRRSDNIPLVPIKTYKWEDIRRARSKGGYPWTYLYKERFDKTIHPEVFRMDGLKKTKTSSASSASDPLDIKEITEDDVKGLEGIDSSYVVIESPILLGRRIEEQIKDAEGIVESADSSDNISQYLEKEERGPEQQLESTETLTIPTPYNTREKHTERALSEEPKRKRKLSIESNYSRVSLSKLGVMKRLKNAKQKIRLPKFVEKMKTEGKTEAGLAKTKRLIEKSKQESLPTEAENPIYIHIPLKPPEGEKDEFSHLEFEKEQPTIPQVVQIQLTEEDDSKKSEENCPDELDLTPKADTINGINLGLSVPNDQEDDVSAIIFLDDDEGCNNTGEYDIIAVDIDENSQEMKMSQIVNTEVRRQVLESIKKVESQPDIDKNAESSGVSLSRSSSKVSKTSKSSLRRKRAKSAEPQKERRGSIESSYSRKSLSRIGLLKKLKQYHIPFVKTQTKKSTPDITSGKIDKEQEDVSRKGLPNKEVAPVYIHIPLKPPQGQTDQFSHLEFEAAPLPPPKIEKDDTTVREECDISDVDTPQTFTCPQFILLTPASDDELLEKPEIPDTPSSETGNISQLGELQQLAKKMVDEIQRPIESVIEEIDNSGTVQATVNTSYENDSEEKKDSREKDKLTVDEEDGLTSMPLTNEEMEGNLKSNMKAECSPLPKKKVSFKRRKSSQASRDDGYEEIESPPVKCETTQVFGDEGMSDMERQKQIETSTLEETNRWSTISDHEYEPVNPPPDDKTEITPPKFHVSEVLNSSPSSKHYYSDDELSPSIKEIQFDIPSNKQSSSSKLNTNLNVKSRNTSRSSRSMSREKEPDVNTNKFQTAIREGATKFKTKLQEMKKPSISIPSFQKPNFKKPKINLPKLPDIRSTFRRNPKEEDTNARGMETEATSNIKGIFDFSTYPRIFKKKKQDGDSNSLKENEIEEVDKIKWPVRRSEAAEIIRIPLHSEDSMDQENEVYPQPEEILEVGQIGDINAAPSSHRYHEDIEVEDEDALQKERQEELRTGAIATFESEESRWDHGKFYRSQDEKPNEDIDEEKKEKCEAQEKGEELVPDETEIDHMESEIVTDLDLAEETETPSIPVRLKGKLQHNESLETNHSRDVGSSVSLLSQHRQGVLEEIDSDQFFLREKGISQDNIDVGKYLSTEIREAFRSPTNALAQIQSFNYEEVRASNQSLPEMKRKQVKKPKRRKTPHTSQEKLRYEPESENEDYNFMPPIRPKRKGRKKKRGDAESGTIPFPETTPLTPTRRMKTSLDNDDDLVHHYDNDQIEDIQASESYNQYKLHVSNPHDTHRRASEPIPAAPARKHKSLKSLNASEQDSIFEDRSENGEINSMDSKNIFMSLEMTNNTETQQQEIPEPPPRSRSKTKSVSRTTSLAGRDSILDRMDSIMFDEELREPVIEEPCIKDLRDAMGYAIVDKNQNKKWEHKFCTVPRSQGGSKPPERPLRNYSTLGPSQPSRKLSRNRTDEEKENTDISQYIEVDDERDLQSGEIIQKIQNRPLPAPPRPPRSKSKPLCDVTSKFNIEDHYVGNPKYDRKSLLDEIEVSTQTEPLPPDFECEEMIHEETDRIMTPSALRKRGSEKPTEVHMAESYNIRDEIVLDNPKNHEYAEETITHGQLLVEPINGARIVPESKMSHEKILSMTNNKEEEVSNVPEFFNNLSVPVVSSETENFSDDLKEFDKRLSEEVKISKLDHDSSKVDSNPKTPCCQLETQNAQDIETIKINNQEPQRPSRAVSQKNEGLELLKTQKLEVTDLDVKRLNVNELRAMKIIVSEIKSANISTNEITSKSGDLKLTSLQLQPDSTRILLKQTEDYPVERLTTTGEEKLDGPVEGENVRNINELFGQAISPSKSCVDPTLCPENNDILLEQKPITETVPNEHCGKLSQKSEEDELCSSNLCDSDSELLKEKNSKQELENRNDEMMKEIHHQIQKNISNSDNNVETVDNFEDKCESNILVVTNEELDGVSDTEKLSAHPPRSRKEQFNISQSKSADEEKQHSESQNPVHELSDVEILTKRSYPVRQSPQLLLIEPEVDDDPPPRPPQPQVPYMFSVAPNDFYTLREQYHVGDSPQDSPLWPSRKHRHRPRAISDNSSEYGSVRISRRKKGHFEPSITQLTGQLIRACSVVARHKLQRLINEINSQLPNDIDPDNNKQMMQVVVMVLLILIVVLLVIGDRKTIHLHHWEYFNPPSDL